MLKKRKRLKKIIYILLLALVLVVTVVLKLLVSGSDALRSQAVVRESVVTAQAQKGTITDNLAAGGTLAQESAEAVTLPGSIEVESYAVSNGDFVQEGDLIAQVDKTSVTDAITQVQEMMNDVDEALADAMDSDSTSEITAPCSRTCQGYLCQRGYQCYGYDVQ